MADGGSGRRAAPPLQHPVTNRILDWRLKDLLPRHDLPGLPEVRRLMRLSWLNGFTFGAFERRVTEARAQALTAIADHARRSH